MISVIKLRGCSQTVLEEEYIGLSLSWITGYGNFVNAPLILPNNSLIRVITDNPWTLTKKN